MNSNIKLVNVITYLIFMLLIPLISKMNPAFVIKYDLNLILCLVLVIVNYQLISNSIKSFDNSYIKYAVLVIILYILITTQLEVLYTNNSLGSFNRSLGLSTNALLTQGIGAMLASLIIMPIINEIVFRASMLPEEFSGAKALGMFLISVLAYAYFMGTPIVLSQVTIGTKLVQLTPLFIQAALASWFYYFSNKNLLAVIMLNICFNVTAMIIFSVMAFV